MQIIVLGMHRSGTSPLTRLLNLMGAYVGAEGVLMEPTVYNPKGHWERLDVYNLHQEFFKSVGVGWHKVCRLNLDEVSSEQRAAFTEQARLIVHKLDAHRPWVLKDPRMCLLLPLWRDLLEAPICVYIYRSPLQVAQSLHTRDGFSLRFGMALWEYYNLAALKHTQGFPRLLVAHRDLMTQPLETVQTLHAELEARGVRGLRLPSEKETLSFIDPALYRERGEAELEEQFANQAQLTLFRAFVERRVFDWETMPSLSAGAWEALQEYEATEETISAYRSTQAALQKKVGEIQQAKEAIQEKLQDMETVKLAEVAQLQTQLAAEQAARAQEKAEEEQLRTEKDSRLKTLEESVINFTNDAERLVRLVQRLDDGLTSVLNSQRWRLGHRLGAIWRKLRLKSPMPMPHDFQAQIAEEFRGWRRTFENRKAQAKVNRAGPRPTLGAPAPVALLSSNGEGEAAEEFTRPVLVEEKKKPLEKIAATETGKVSVIILNRNGAHHLKGLFETFLAHNTYLNIEFIVVDHASTDGSRDAIRSFAPRLPLRLITYDENYSFAYSNNRAGEQATGEYLFFLNNDILLQSDILARLVRYLEDPTVGLVGLKLAYPPRHAVYPGAVQHVGIKFSGDLAYGFYRPYELGVKADTNIVSYDGAHRFPAVTGAALLCRREEFLNIGGFCEAYWYGYEDVDLCLTYFFQLRKSSLSANGLLLIHNEGATRNLTSAKKVRQQRLHNQAVLQKRYGYAINRTLRQELAIGERFWSEARLVLAFAVTEAHAEARAGDYFTALELAAACAEQCGWETRLLARNQDWYDLTDVDVLVVMVDAYDLSKVHHAKPSLVTIAWLRNWFERWTERPSFDGYDIYLCSSQKATSFLHEQYGKLAHVFPIATNEQRFCPEGDRLEAVVDYCFTGSRWNVERDLERSLIPRQVQHAFALYGHGWEDQDDFRPYWKGFLPYSQLPSVYRTARVVIDDANHTTKPWGSVNSRVFDALACGALVLTNGRIGAEEIFGEKLPVYETAGELHALLDHYLHDEPTRQALVAELQRTVLAHHTYAHRAVQLQSILTDFRTRKFRIAVKIGVPKMDELHEWGDYHFACGLRRALVKHGHAVRIDILPDWYTPQGFGDDAVIVLRGLSQYEPNPAHINLMWNISHPDKVTPAEYNLYDHVFVASQLYTEELMRRVAAPVSCLLQCTDPQLFYPDSHAETPEEAVLFVGNSRKQFRPIVKDALAAGLPLAVYGTRWGNLIPSRYIRGTHIPNTELRRYYSKCKVLLNDHWPSMREAGFLSNRLFDAGACGAFIISDQIEGAQDLFGDALIMYRDAQDLKHLVNEFLVDEEKRRNYGEQLRELVIREHTFEQRATEILGVLEKIDARKRFGAAQVTIQERLPYDNETQADAPQWDQTCERQVQTSQFAERLVER
jgi:spore maturation protein CgeB/GT2 family glycosyltransferase